MRFPEFSGEWESTPISTIADIIGGGTPDTSVDEYWGGNIQWFTPSEIGKEKYAYLSDRTITEAGLKNSSAKLLPQGTVLLSTRATIGECSIATAECTTNQGFQSLVAKKNNVSSEFLYYIVAKIKREMLRRSCGSTFLEISSNELKKIHANIPSKAEQEKLVSLLSLIDQRIETQKKIIKALPKSVRLGAEGFISTYTGQGAIKNLFNRHKSFDEDITSYCDQKEALQQFRSELQNFIEVNCEGKPLVFFIDELDRCRPDYAVEFQLVAQIRK